METNDPAKQTKEEKKRHKAELKRLKKEQKAREKAADVSQEATGAPLQTDTPKEIPVNPVKPAIEPDGVLTPAERSARAAEEKVRLTRIRIWIGLIAIIIATLSVAVGLLNYLRK